MLKKRIIPCLDIKEGRTVKGVNFEGLRDAGDPAALAKRYVEEGADELVFLDINATHENRKTLVGLVGKVAEAIDIPFTVGGGIGSVEDAANIILAGADKVSINSAAVRRPQLISDIAARFGKQCVTLAVDIRLHDDAQWYVYLNGGRIATDNEAHSWTKAAEQLGAGEILLTSMNHDGVKQGFACGITDSIARSINIPVIASGGAGNEAHFFELFDTTAAAAGLAASIFHFGEVPVPRLKNYLKSKHIPVR
ncbi:MAG: imidazole glycerol phosphate synthase subunit HisF [Edaphocola sp.]